MIVPFLSISLVLILTLTGFFGYSTRAVKTGEKNEPIYKSVYHTDPPPKQAEVKTSYSSTASKNAGNTSTAGATAAEKNAPIYKSVYTTEPLPIQTEIPASPSAAASKNTSNTATASATAAENNEPVYKSVYSTEPIADQEGNTTTATNTKGGTKEASNAGASKNDKASDAISGKTEETIQSMTGMANIYFDFNRHNIKKSAMKNLEKEAALLKKNPNVKIVIEGYCDERGSAEYNVALGEKRARSVEKFLKNKGVKAERMTTISYGKEKPFCSGHDEKCWQLNRTVHFLYK